MSSSTLALIARKDAIQAELDALFSVLSANQSTMNSPLLDADGFPRADIDVYAVRNARVRIIELRNDLNAVMDDIKTALEGVFTPSAGVSSPPTDAQNQTTPDTLKPFARVDGVAPGSPASEAGLLRDDLLLRFGSLAAESFSGSSLQPLADLVAAHENRALRVLLRRNDREVSLSFTPRKGWGGRGLLGCHISPIGQ